MKIIMTLFMALSTITALAIVGSGSKQIVTIARDSKKELSFQSDDGKNFSDVDSCAKHCWNRSGSVNTNSTFSNSVEIHIQANISAEDRQYIGDQFVENCVYPHNIYWTENGKTNVVKYRPDNKSFKAKRELK